MQSVAVKTGTFYAPFGCTKPELPSLRFKNATCTFMLTAKHSAFNRMFGPALARLQRVFSDFSRAAASGEPNQILISALKGRVNPMPEQMKRLTLRHYARHSNIRIFVETGTFRGETIQFLLPEMEEVHSVELSDELYRAAMRKFEGQPKVHLYKGNSASVLPVIIDKLNKPALLWLDAHYSAKITAHGPQETPILAELRAIFERSKALHVILIDDAREFEGKNTYPALSEVRKMATENGYCYQCRFDIIRLTPRT